jgi:hypothetical protein
MRLGCGGNLGHSRGRRAGMLHAAESTQTGGAESESARGGISGRLPRATQQRLPIYVRILRSLRPVHDRSVLACALLVSRAGLLLPRRRAPASSTDKRGRRHSATCSGDAHCCGVSSTERADGLPTLRRFRRRYERLRHRSRGRRTAMTAQSHYPRMHQGDVPSRHNARSTRIARAFALSRRAKSRDIAHLQSGAVTALRKDESPPLLRLGDEIGRIVDETHEKPWGILESSSRIFGLNSALAGPEARGRSELCCFYRKWTAQAIVEIGRTHCRHAWTRSAGGVAPRPSGSERSPVADRS